MHFSFQYSFSSYGSYLLPLNFTIKFHLILFDFAIDFLIYIKWLQMDQWMDRPMDGWINETMFFSYTDAMDASENDDFPTDYPIFTKALGTNRPMDSHATSYCCNIRI